MHCKTFPGMRLATLVGCIALLFSTTASAQDQGRLRSLSTGQALGDSRTESLKDLNGYFPFVPSSSPAAWHARRAQLRQAVQVALGLWPMPAATPANAVIHGRRELDGYSIEKVFFESFPGHFVTGNLYRPLAADANAKLPAVLTPHGHYANGRFTDAGVDDVRRTIVTGGERFEDGGRSPIQSRCVQLARMGCVVFHYDMVGYCDSTQISYEVAHRFGKQRPHMNGTERWGFFSPQAESMLQSIIGLQTYNSIRAFDWLASLPDVDPKRIAVTGSSGGGTQTFLLAAIDDRPSVVVPAVMVSTAMQGGCTCENGCLLRVGRGNVDFAAMIAPRPLCLLSADDWTREMATKGFPELRQHYQMLSAADQLEHHPLTHFPHNYNYVSRAVMYQFLNRHLQLNLPEPIVEEEYERQSADRLTVWNKSHPRPAVGDDVERDLLEQWTAATRARLDAVRPRDADSLEAYKQIVSPAIDVLIGRRYPNDGRREFEQSLKKQQDGYWLFTGIIENRPASYDPGRPQPIERLPVAMLTPVDWDQGRVAIWIDERGKDGLYRNGAPHPAVQRLLASGVAVVGVDLSEQGEHRSAPGPLTETRIVNNPREAATYTLGYNPSLFAQRVHDVLTTVGFVAEHERSPQEIWLVGTEGSGHWVAAARAQAGHRVDRAAIDTGGFRFMNVASVRDPDLLPGGGKYDDLPGMLAVTAPQELWLAGEQLQLVRSAYDASGSPNALSGPHVPDTETPSWQPAVAWLLSE